MSAWNYTASAADESSTLEIIEYDDTDNDGCVGEVSVSTRVMDGTPGFRPGMLPGRVRVLVKLSHTEFRSFVDAIAGRYHAGGPK